ncbi:MAG: M50 family metallopeptidase [Spirochaetia bacterium]|nr:M50 family metallopeptidase [Spirochaetia bacterium]
MISVLVGLVATIFWDTSFLYPAKVLVVLVHEMFHGVAALATGADLKRIVLSAGESGSTSVHGLRSGWPFVVSVSAGYLGSTFAGAVLLNRGFSGSLERVTLGAFSLMLWYMSFLFTETGTLAFWTGMGWALASLAAVLLGRRVSRVTLIALGTLFLWYCLYDLFDFSRDLSRSDAGILAEHFRRLGWVGQGESAASFIAGSWIIAMVGILAAFLVPPVLRRIPAPVPAPAFAPGDPALDPALAGIVPLGDGVPAFGAPVPAPMATGGQPGPMPTAPIPLPFALDAEAMAQLPPGFFDGPAGFAGIELPPGPAMSDASKTRTYGNPG